MSDIATINPHKTHLSVPLVMAFAMGAALIGGTWTSAVKLTTIETKLQNLEGQRVLTPEQIRALVEAEVKRIMDERKVGLRLRCNQFPSRGVFDDCNEVLR